MRNIALIPARGGSKRFPGKNLAILDNKPLVAWTIEAVTESGLFEKVIFSSDNTQLLSIASQYEEIETEHRAASLSGDSITASNVLDNLIRHQDSLGIYYDICGLFLPTCPFRTSEDIKNAYKLLDKNTDSVVSFKESTVRPEFMFSKDENDYALPLIKNSSVFSGKTRMQDYETLYYPNGAIYLGWQKSFMQNRTFYTKNMRAYVMPSNRSLDIDYEEDLLFAELLLRARDLR